MRDYSLYFLDHKNHIKDVVDFECADDDQAIEGAEQYRDGRDLELWQRARCVKKMPKLS